MTLDPQPTRPDRTGPSRHRSPAASTPASLAARADEWRALVASSVTSVEADGRAAVRLVLRDTDAA